VWILSGYKIFIPSIIAALLLVSIVFFNSFEFSILFRDLSIALASLSLAIAHWPLQNKVKNTYNV